MLKGAEEKFVSLKSQDEIPLLLEFVRVKDIPFKVPVVADVQIAPLNADDEAGACKSKSCINAVVAI